MRADMTASLIDVRSYDSSEQIAKQTELERAVSLALALAFMLASALIIFSVPSLGELILSIEG